MNALDILLTRRSVPPAALTEPGPTQVELEKILEAAHTAADHGHMRPWRFHIVRQERRPAYVEMLLEALKESRPDTPEAKLDQKRAVYNSVPVAIAVAAKTVHNPKVPDIEQIISVGAAAQNMLNAAHCLGYGAILLSGPAVLHPRVKASLGLEDSDYFVGTVFIGTPKAQPPVNKHDMEGTVFEWSADD